MKSKTVIQLTTSKIGCVKYRFIKLICGCVSHGRLFQLLSPQLTEIKQRTKHKFELTMLAELSSLTQRIMFVLKQCFIFSWLLITKKYLLFCKLSSDGIVNSKLWKFWCLADYFCCQHLNIWFCGICRVCISPLKFIILYLWITLCHSLTSLLGKPPIRRTVSHHTNSLSHVTKINFSYDVRPTFLQSSGKGTAFIWLSFIFLFVASIRG